MSLDARVGVFIIVSLLILGATAYFVPPTQKVRGHAVSANEIPARVIALLQSMLAVDPAKRPQSARELLSAIHRCYTKFSTEARARRKRSIIVAAGAIFVLGTIAIGTWFYQHAQSSA